MSSAWFGFLPESLYVYARLHTEAAKEEEDDEMDGYRNNEDDDNGDGFDKEMDGYPICIVNIPSV